MQKIRFNLSGGSVRPLTQFLVMMGVILLAAFATYQLILTKPEQSARRAFANVHNVKSVVAERGDNQPNFVVYGETIAARSVDLRSLVSGEIIEVSPNLRAGARVEEGETLVRIDPFNYEGALAEARANLLEAKAKVRESEARIALEQSKRESAEEQLGFAEIDMERIMTLREGGTATQQQVDARNLVVSQRRQALEQSSNTIQVEEARLTQIDATIERLEWRVRQAERNVRNTNLVAPFRGVIRNSSAEAGRLANINDVLVSLYEEDALEVRFTLSDAQYGRLSDALVGRSAKIAWTVGEATYSWDAMIDRAGAEIVSTRGGVEVFAAITESSHGVTLRPGAFVEVTIADKMFEGTIPVPDTAIYNGDTVYVIENRALVERKVVIAAYDNQTALVASGIEDGDEVLVTRITEVSDGLGVRVVNDN